LQIDKKHSERKLDLDYEAKMKEYDWKIQAVDEIIALARGH